MYSDICVDNFYMVNSNDSLLRLEMDKRKTRKDNNFKKRNK